MMSTRKITKTKQLMTMLYICEFVLLKIVKRAMILNRPKIYGILRKKLENKKPKQELDSFLSSTPLLLQTFDKVY